MLGVDRQATQQDIKKAIAGAPSNSTRTRTRITRGGRFLQGGGRSLWHPRRPAKRAVYDRYGHEGSAADLKSTRTSSAEFSDIFGGGGSIFEELFGDFFGGGRRRRSTRGAICVYDLEITFKEAVKGAETRILVPRNEPCEKCDGSGATRGTQTGACPTCGGHGQVRYQQGFSSSRGPCAQCQGTGRFTPNPCARCAGTGHVARERGAHAQDPGGCRYGLTPAAHGRR